ncbi:DUF4430 domain-containing protein [Clostridiaceae bacterium UIB06]|uniref:DUF4430 domain-containing protein n=1 Tax=Clostridium thailandense TaxID=2794346 RepID=A0A949TMP0_9CLOT|nr:DUF4430 domain-containing protein [Clostridium thailandense]MBV7275205.1 DUF4430 domain-containing protein [Clostridium thailandense]MCH5136841.1 DUF4430 domain-containing protein [Clostridiaceae bacterium UIB06]
MNNNKKKYLIAVSAFIVCFVMFVFAIKAQKMYADTLTKKQEASQKVENKSTDTKAKENKTEAGSTKPQDNSSKDAKNSTTVTSETAAKPDESKTKQDITGTSSNNTGSASNSQTNPAVKAEASESDKVKQEDSNSQMTLQIIDTVNGNKMILQKDISNMDGETVGYIMERVLDDAKIKYKATGSASTLYFAAIDGLEEKKAGKLSGWCYYVKKNGEGKFHKPNVGSGQWTYHKGDVVVWKYLADGIHDGYEDDWGKGSF